jgi:hypothetical protein
MLQGFLSEFLVFTLYLAVHTCVFTDFIVRCSAATDTLLLERLFKSTRQEALGGAVCVNEM